MRWYIDKKKCLVFLMVSSVGDTWSDAIALKAVRIVLSTARA